MIKRGAKVVLATLVAANSVSGRPGDLPGDVYPSCSHNEAIHLLDCSKPVDGAAYTCTYLTVKVEIKKGSGPCEL